MNSKNCEVFPHVIRYCYNVLIVKICSCFYLQCRVIGRFKILLSLFKLLTNSSVGIVIRLPTGQWRNCGSVPGKDKEAFLL